MVENNEEQINNLYWWNLFPYNYKVIDKPLADPFHIKKGETLYFRLAPHFEEWSNMFLMKILIEINLMYTVEKKNEYKLRQEAIHILSEKAGKFGYYAARFNRIFFGIFNYVVIVSLVLV